ncbi:MULTISPECIES: aldose epimerase family protein [Jannaschia]|nr:MULTISPECIES: aldose epimerase family protein [unclassified Jannaschia]
MDLNRYVISGHGLTATFTDWGASLVDLRLEGHAPPLVLGLEQLEGYAAGHASYMGAMVGRCANRMAQGRFTLDGQVHQLDRNFLDKHHLHGGSAGIGKRVWRVVEQGDDEIAFQIDLADGEMGYPGAMHLEARFRCGPEATLRIDYHARADAATLCNIAHHSYWCLDDSGSVADHILTVAADRYTPVDAELIPVGVAPVDGTAFDFRGGQALPGDGLLDHNLCLSDGREALRQVGVLRSRVSGVAMAICTTEPGLQVYDGAKLSPPVPGLDGRRYGAHAGVALEPQVWPDAPNHDDFPEATLRPGETYHQITTFSFSKD